MLETEKNRNKPWDEKINVYKTYNMFNLLRVALWVKALRI